MESPWQEGITRLEVDKVIFRAIRSANENTNEKKKLVQD